MSHLLLINLPDIVLHKILSFLTYDEIARFRIVCKRLDTMCKQILNKGFTAAERYHSQSIKAVKIQLPRRESERRLHPLARHWDILTAIETRLSMLSMTYMKYVDVGHCCFIPGKVIDEIFGVLRYLKDCKSPPRAHEILHELRDISSMAMEHFEEKIAPGLKNNRSENYSNPFSTPQCSMSSAVYANSSRPFFTQDRLNLEFKNSLRRDQKYKKELQTFRNKLIRHKSRINAQGKKVTNHTVVLAEHNTEIAEMKRTIAEMDHKISDLVGELCYLREENSVLAAALGIAFNRNKAKVSSLIETCTSQESNKRKPSESSGTAKDSKKYKLDKGSSDLSYIVNNICDDSMSRNSKEKVCELVRVDESDVDDIASTSHSVLND